MRAHRLQVAMMGLLPMLMAARGFSTTNPPQQVPGATTMQLERNGSVLFSSRGGSQKRRPRNVRSALSGHSIDGRDGVRSTSFRLKGMSVALAMVYFTVMGAKCALPAVLALLKSPTEGLTFLPDGGSPHGQFSSLLIRSTLAIALGKMLLGPVIDHFGGIRSLEVALGSLSVLLFTLSASQSFKVFAAAWIFVDFIFSACWAACINAIHQSFPEKEWPRHVGTLAASARSGNAVAFAFFAALLKACEGRMSQKWRPVFAVSALLQLIPLSLLFIFGKTDHLVDRSPGSSPSFRSSLATLAREASTLDFWLHLVNRSVLMVFASFLLFVPTLMMEVYGTSSSFAAQVGSIYAIGCLIAVTVGSKAYAQLSGKRKVAALVGLLGTATVSSVAQLCHVMGVWHLSPNFSALTMFLWGLAFAIPFYIPPSMFALERGGVESSATIADVFDTGGFALLAAFNGHVAGIARNTPSAWIPTFQMTTACSLLSMIVLVVAALRESFKVSKT